MTNVVLDHNLKIDVVIRKSVRAKRISLRISRLDGRLTMTLPLWATESDGIAFLKSQHHWVTKNLRCTAPQRVIQFGSEIPIEGRHVRITAHAHNEPRLTDTTLFLKNKPDSVMIVVKAYLKALARNRLAVESDKYAKKIGQSYRKITLRDTRSRWGSCNTNKDLMYSWRLIMAPPDILSYVAAHEVAHLQEMNHGPNFWALVQDLYPDYPQAKAWLKANGATLHHWQFKA